MIDKNGAIVREDREDDDQVRLPHDFVREVDLHMAEESALFRSVKFAGVIFSALLGVMVWVFAEKNSDIRAMQSTLNQHSMQINETLVLLKTDLEAGKRDRELLEKHIDSAIDYRVNRNGGERR